MASRSLLTTLVKTLPDRKPLSQSAHMIRAIAFVVAWIATLYALAIISIWLSWDSMSWWLFWVMTGLTVFLFPYVLILISIARTHFLPVSRSLLREILINADERLIPFVSIQPTPIKLSNDEERFGPFESSPMQVKDANGRVNIYVGIAIGIPLAVLIFSMLPAMAFQSTPSLLVFIPVGAGCLGLVNISLLILWLVRMIFKRLFVTADSNGITWHYGAKGQKQHMDWLQARALLKVVAASSSRSSSMVTNYVLIGTDATLIWSVSHKARIFSDSERLLGAVVAYTKLPLRDATQFATTLSGAGKDTRRLLDHYGLTKNLSFDLLLGLQSQRSSKMTRQQIAGIVVAVIFAIVPFAIGAWAQSYSSSYFGSLSQRIAAEQPIYRTSFTNVDGAWPNLPSDSYYVQGMYEIHDPLNKERRIASLAGHTFGNAAYTVTATESGAVPDGSDDGIGLIIHASANNSDFVAFDVKYDGEWELWHYSLQLFSPDVPDGIEFLDSGTSDAVHQGPGATNTLMIVTSAHSALLFINGQFIEQYKPDNFVHVDLSQTGSAGIFVNSAAMTGDFTNFAVSPAPPIDFWNVLQTAPPWHK